MRLVIVPGQADWPESRYLPEAKEIQVRGRYEQPGLLKLWSVVYAAGAALAVVGLAGGARPLVGSLSTIVFAMEGGWTPADNPLGWGVIGATAALWFFKRRFWNAVVMRFLGREVDIRISAAQISVKKGDRFTPYLKVSGIGFRTDRHSKALAEQRRAEEGVLFVGKKYRNSLEVVMDYGEQRIVLAEMDMLQESMANALVMRLQTVAKEISGLLKQLESDGGTTSEEAVGEDNGDEETATGAAGGGGNWRDEIRDKLRWPF